MKPDSAPAITDSELSSLDSDVDLPPVSALTRAPSLSAVVSAEQKLPAESWPTLGSPEEIACASGFETVQALGSLTTTALSSSDLRTASLEQANDLSETAPARSADTPTLPLSASIAHIPDLAHATSLLPTLVPMPLNKVDLDLSNGAKISLPDSTGSGSLYTSADVVSKPILIFLPNPPLIWRDRPFTQIVRLCQILLSTYPTVALLRQTRYLLMYRWILCLQLCYRRPSLLLAVLLRSLLSRYCLI